MFGRVGRERVVGAMWGTLFTATLGVLIVIRRGLPHPIPRPYLAPWHRARVGFLALAHKFSDAAAQGKVLAPAKSIDEMQRVAFNNYLDAVVCGFFVVLVVAMCYFAITIGLKAWRQAGPTVVEIPPAGQVAGAA